MYFVKNIDRLFFSSAFCINFLTISVSKLKIWSTFSGLYISRFESSSCIFFVINSIISSLFSASFRHSTKQPNGSIFLYFNKN